MTTEEKLELIDMCNGMDLNASERARLEEFINQVSDDAYDRGRLSALKV